MKKLLLFVIACTLGLFGTVRAQETITIGNGDYATYSLADTYEGSAGASQHIYTAEEIGMAGTITSIAFNKKNGADYDRGWCLYLKHIDEDEFTSQYNYKMSSDDLVYEGTFKTQNGWNVFDITPFQYDGVRNLLVTVVDNSRNYGGDQNWYYTQYTMDDPVKCLTRYGAGIDITTQTGWTNFFGRFDFQLTIAAGEGGEGGEEGGETEELASSFTFDFEDGTLDGLRAFAGEGSNAPLWAVSNDSYYSNGTNVIFSESYDGGFGLYPSINNYIVTENAYAITAGSKLSWYVRNADYYAAYADAYEVVISEDGENFTQVWSGTAQAGVYEQELSLAEYAGKNLYIGFRHYCTDEYGGAALVLDNITLTAGEGGEEPIEPEIPVAPAAPVVAATATETTVTLTWEAVENATSYNIYTPSSFSSNVLGLTETTYTFENLTAGEYCFQVSAVNDVDESDATEVCATIEAPVVEEPAGEMCVIDITLEDSYGDGWNGNVLKVEYGTTTKEFTLSNGKTATETMEIPSGSHVTATFICTSAYGYPQENGFTIAYESGEVIVSVDKNTYAMNTPVTQAYEFDLDCTPKAPATPVVKAVATGGSTIALTITSAGAESYNIYNGTETVATGVTENPYTVEGLTAATEYCFTVVAVNGVGNSEASEAACATTFAEGTTIVTIGDGDIAQMSAPIYNAGPGAVYSLSQQIYTAEEIGLEGNVNIYSISFHHATGNNNARDIVVYLTNVEKELYEGNYDWAAFSEEDIVYQGVFNFGQAEDWVTIEFQNAFEYAGGNIAVTVYDKTGSGYGYSYDICDKFYSYQVNEWRGMYVTKTAEMDFSALGTYYATSMNTGSWGSPANAYYINNVKFRALATEGGEEPTPDEPIVDAKYRLVSTGEGYKLVTYVYESETSDKVIEIREGQDSGYGQYIAFLQYDENGVLTGYEYGWAENGAINKSGYSYQYTAVVYTYTDGVVTSYTETEYTGWSEPYETAYTITRDAEGNITEVAYGSSKLAYTYENGKLVSKTKSYYDQWAETPGYVTESEIEYAYDENGNCTVATQYSAYDGEKVARKGTEYVYATTIAVENVVAFAYPEAVAPAHANLITKEISYEYNEDYNTGEIYKDYYTVTPYVYNPEVASEPLAPMALTVSAMSDTELRLSWVAVESAEKFYIYNGEELFAESGSDVYYAEGLEANTEYCFSVSAVNGEFESPRSEVVCGKTLGLVAIYPTEIEFGEVRLGNYWAKEETVASVEIDPLGKTITSITCDNEFFTLPEFDATADYIVFDLGYDKTAEAGEYTGNIVVTLEGGVTVTAPVTATAYAPVTPDVFELAQEITFTEGVYTNTPDFATLHDDYLMPAEEEWNDGELMDAVYTFTLETPAVVTVNVTGENAQYAIYQAEGFEFPTEETFVGIDRAVSTAFSFDFNDGELDAFTIEDYDAYQDYSWDVEEDENGGYQLVSYSFQGWYGEDNSWQYYNDADERIITNAAFNITEKSVLTFDMNVNGNWEGVIIEVTKDGETFTEIENIVDQSYSYDWFAKRINIGEKLAALGLEYGEYRISLYHDLQGYGKLNIDNLVLSEREYAFPEGTYFLFAAAEDAFSVEVTAVETEEVVIVPEAKAYRLESVVNFMETVYTYDEVFTNRVVEMEEEGITTTLSYNKAGQVVSAEQVVVYEGEEGEPVEEVLSSIEYTYNADGTLATYTETAPTPAGAMATTTTEYTYEDGRLAKVENADWEIEMTYVYNEDGTVKEIVEPYMTTVFTYENGNLVKTTIGWNDEETGEFFAEAEEVYTYANGNVVKQESYEYGSLYQVHEFFYDATIAAEDVYTFELPHMALASVEPVSNNVLVKELSYYSYYDEEADETIVHSYTMTVYNYNPAIEMAPITPINFAAEVVDGVVELTWEAFADAETFTVYQDSEVIAENVTEGFYAVEGLEAGEYCFVVRAHNAAGNSATTEEACVTIEGDEPIVPEPTVPAAPVVRVKEVTSTTVILEWDVVEGATKYALYSGDEKLGELAETIAGVQGLDPKTTYCFTVTAINEAGESAHSEEVCATTLPGEGVAENEAAFNIYPNPAVDRVVIETEATIEAVTIYTLTGVMVYSEVDFNNNTINVSDFASGVYVMKVRTENGEVVKRFIKK